jgi:hypothetical protein
MKNQILKLSLAICFVMGLSMTSYGQASDKTWSIGPELGVNFAKFGNDGDDTDYNTGLVLGGFLTYSIRNTHAFTAKVLFSQKGAKSADGETKSHLNYVEVPVVLRVFFNRDGAVRPNVFVGPSFGFLTGVKGKVGDGDYEDVPNYEDTYDNFDLGLGVGLGLNCRVANEMYFIIDARYTYGLSDIAKASIDVNNQAIAVSAGLSFGLSNN